VYHLIDKSIFSMSKTQSISNSYTFNSFLQTLCDAIFITSLNFSICTMLPLSCDVCCQLWHFPSIHNFYIVSTWFQTNQQPIKFKQAFEIASKIWIRLLWNLVYMCRVSTRSNVPNCVRIGQRVPKYYILEIFLGEFYII